MRRAVLLGVGLLLAAGVSAKAGKLVLCDGNFRIVVSEGEAAPVKLAAETLRQDFGKVMRWWPAVTSAPGDGKTIDIVVVNGPAGGEAGLKEPDGFESHAIYADAASRRIYLHGADMRGTIYAIYSFSEKFLGVPPLWYYCSWKPDYKARVTVSADYLYRCPSPQVRYRAWFPNDTDLFTPWRKLSADNDERWLETMLRLKLNTVELEGTVTYPGSTLNGQAGLLRKYGLVLTSHHHIALNSDFRQWGDYWRKVRGVEPPAFSLARLQDLVDFWSYGVGSVVNSGVENLWQIAFRGAGDQPFWALFPDAPADDKARAEVINRIMGIQLELIKRATGDNAPYVRTTFYDELSDLLAKGYLNPPAGENMLWTYVAARRDHYPNDDIVAFDTSCKVKLGYYMNLQFTSTGAHLAPAEGPWKMEANYRYVDTKAPLQFSVVNAGNIREEILSMSANAAMMWGFDKYDTDDFLLRYCRQYFGDRHAGQIAGLYRDYFNAYWQQKPSDFPGGFERQYIFQDLRYARAFDMIGATFWKYTSAPLKDIGFERVPGRSFRLGFSDQDSLLMAGMAQTAPRFKVVADRCERMLARLPEDKCTFLRDNLYAYCRYMENLSYSMLYYVTAYRGQSDRDACRTNLEQAIVRLEKAQAALLSTQHGVFGTWYAGDSRDGKFNIDRKLAMMRNLRNKLN